jgi:ATP-dependent exoDNAse (exonuclease V) beta subunit
VYEGFYASILYVYFQSLGIHIIGEDVTNRGRIDLTLFVEDKIYIVEFKMSSNTQPPLAQIQEKKYYQKYQNQNKEIYLVGIVFDEKEKNIDNFIWEKI